MDYIGLVDDVGEARQGDKILVLDGEHRGKRGTIDLVASDSLTVLLGSETSKVLPEDIQNYSAAARKAWRTMPERKVGRPKGGSAHVKRPVTIRVDAELWDRLGAAVAAGHIRSRETAINEWIEGHVGEMLGEPDDQRD